MNNKAPKILFYDIETSANTSYTWGKYEQNVIAFEKEWELLSFAFKFEGDKEVQCYSRRQFSERQLAKKLHSTLSSADLVVTHNGISFDNKKSNAKFIQFGLPPAKPAPQVDTCKLARNAFQFNSNSLNDLGKLLKVGEKEKHPGFDMWLGCMRGKVSSLRLMEKYNKKDVVLLEKIYLKLKPFAKSLPNLTLLAGYRGCPSCRSTKCQKRGFKATAASIQQQYACMSCGHWFQTSKKAVIG